MSNAGRFNPKSMKRSIVLGAILFPAAAAVFPDWSNSATGSGGLTAALVLLALAAAVAFRWNKRLSAEELKRSRYEAHKVSGWRYVVPFGALGALIAVGIRGAAAGPFLIGFLFVFMAGVLVGALATMLFKKGLFQEG